MCRLKQTGKPKICAAKSWRKNFVELRRPQINILAIPSCSVMKKLALPKIRSRHRKLLELVKENRFRLYLSMVCSILVAATTGATALLIKNVIDDIFIAKDALMLWKLPVVVIILFLVRGLGLYGQEYFMSYVGLNIIRSLRNSLYDRIQDLPLSFFHKMKTGVLMARITNDVALIRSMVSDAVKAAFRQRGRRRDGPRCAAITPLGTVGPSHHVHGVPSHHALAPPFAFSTTRNRGLLVGRNRIAIRSIG